MSPTRSGSTADPRFAALKEALAHYASDPDDPPHPEREDHLQAAVSLVVRGREALEVLLIKRAHHERDPWSGHMALPGGRRDASDENLRHTAMRETLEETGVELAGRSANLGRLDVVAPQSLRLPRLTIHPYVFGVPADTRARVASPAEVDAVHWVPLDVIGDPAARGTLEIDLPAGRRSFPCIEVVGDVVWGLTYRILTDFLGVYPEEKLRGRRG